MQYVNVLCILCISKLGYSLPIKKSNSCCCCCFCCTSSSLLLGQAHKLLVREFFFLLLDGIFLWCCNDDLDNTLKNY